MRIKTTLAGIILMLTFPFVMNAQKTDEIFTIYLVRHAEKEVSTDNPKDPPLTPCGEQRAESLASFFGEIDLDAIYSTEYLRTKDTAQPTAKEKGKMLKYYDPKQLGDFAKLLIKNRQDVLVVGHSNTTPVLAGLLVGEELNSFDESIYDRIYQVVLHKKKGRLHILQTAFVCKD
jgi:broad specificity phosphatase PhoE